jgi:hypothetical protein
MAYVTIVFMIDARAGIARVLPVLLLLALYWPAVTGWFFQDDFGWLNLHHDVHSAGDLAGALFAPKAHGNMRPLGENAYWLVFPAVFGASALPLHIAGFLTQAASLLLLGGVVRRLTGSRLAAFAAQILWMANAGLAPAMGWLSIYNQLLSAFFFLLAFYFLLRYVESERPAYWVCQWIAFVLGLGALESNVVYPALAGLYALLFARPLLRKVAPMFAVSAAAVWVHFHFAPPAASGAYAIHFDARVFATAWTFWAWGLGPMPPWVTVLLTVAVGVLIASAIRKGKYGALLGLAWFVIPLLPYLALPGHKMDYYLAVPAIGIAMMGAFALADGWNARAPGRMVTAACLLVYLGASLPKSLTVARWEHARGERLENLVLGVEEVRARAPRKTILLEGIDTGFFWSGIADLPFRAFALPHVYLAPAEFVSIQAGRDLLSKYILPAALARRDLDNGTALLYRFDGEMLRRASGDTVPAENEPRFVNIADDVFRDYIGQGWSGGPRGLRQMKGAATVRIGGPHAAADHLYIGVFETHDFHLSVSANGFELPVELAYRNIDLSEYRATLPAPALGWTAMEVSLQADQSPLLFGYVEVR